MIDLDLLYHRLPYEPAAYFVCRDQLTLEQFRELARHLSACSEAQQGSTEAHWLALQQRTSGRSSWDTVVPLSVLQREPDISEQRRRKQTIANLVKHRGYASWIVDGLEVTIDLFNPANELELTYPGASAPVVALGFAPIPGPGGTNIYRTLPKPSFYALLQRAGDVMQPLSVVVHGRLHSVFAAIAEGRMAPDRSPWSLLFAGTLVSRPGNEQVQVLNGSCAHVAEWPGQRLYVQVTAGFGGGMPKEYDQVASMLGKVPWTRYVEGRDPKASATDRDFEWPTAVRPNRTSAPLSELLGSGDVRLVRQAMFQMHAAGELQTRGHRIRAVQAPLIGKRVSITIPIVGDRSPALDACAYTESEAWTPARIAQLKAWLEDLREESDADVIVVAREASAEVASLADVKQFQHLPCESLPPLRA